MAKKKKDDLFETLVEMSTAKDVKVEKVGTSVAVTYTVDRISGTHGNKVMVPETVTKTL